MQLFGDQETAPAQAGKNKGKAGDESVKVLKGAVRRVVFYNPENGFGIIKLTPEASTVKGELPPGQEAVVKGTLGQVSPGEILLIKGVWIFHNRYGKQFRAFEATRALPETAEGLQAYLGSGMIDGIGREYARKIVEHFGEETLGILENTPGRLTEVPGIGKVRSEKIIQAWGRHQAVREVMIFLQSYGISTAYAHRILKIYGNQAVFQVTSNPYRLCEDISGIGFKSADRVAMNMGIPADSIERFEAAILYLLTQGSENGHCFLPLKDIVDQARRLLELDEDQAPEQKFITAISRLQNRGRVVEAGSGDEKWIYLDYLYTAEGELAENLIALTGSGVALQGGSNQNLRTPFSGQSKSANLTAEQQKAVEAVLRERLVVVTGGPGTGKTTTVRSMIRALEEACVTYALASPTGRAAKRLGETTGRRGRTIHRLLEFSPQGSFARDASSPLTYDAVIIDEASMLDLPLANSLVKALKPGARLVLVGDVNQLPSVGPGDVLRDIMGSGLAKVIELNTIFRQAEESLIIVNAHRINQGLFPVFRQEGESGKKDFYFIKAEEAEDLPGIITGLVRDRLPSWGRFDPFDDIQVITPMHKGSAGVKNLNQTLKESLNKGGDGIQKGSLVFDTGDKVMQVRNNYTKEVFNGDTGRVVRTDRDTGRVIVNFDGRHVSYDREDLLDLEHAYAISIHKSQGSEYPAVIIPVHTQHFIMLWRNLLYTAVTRARKLVVLVGTSKALRIALQKDDNTRRYTNLMKRLREV